MSGYVDLLRKTLAPYKKDARHASTTGDREELLNIVATAETLIEALEKGDTDEIMNKTLGFSRNVSDAYCVQPPSYKALAECVKRIKTEIM